MLEEDLSQEISKYYDGELSEEESEVLTLKLIKDTEAKKALDMLKDIEAVLDDNEFPGERNFKSVLKEKVSGLQAGIKKKITSPGDDLPLPIVNAGKQETSYPLWLILLCAGFGLGVLALLVWAFK